jgi:MFS family permease
MTPLTGRFCDIYGRKATLLFSMGAFIVGSLACALSTSIVQLFVFRAIQGIGGGGIMSAAMIIVADLTPAKTRANWIAPLAAMFALSSVVGPLLGGYLTDGPGWRFAFWINLPVSSSTCRCSGRALHTSPSISSTPSRRSAASRW